TDMSQNRKPIIGIVSKHFLKDTKRPNMFIRDEIKQAVFDNGGIAIGIILPKDEKRDVQDNWKNNLSDTEYDNLISQIRLCDGILFQGGGACDNYEMIAAGYCYDNNIPTLGICCGQNVMVRALGGTTRLIEDPEKHNTDDLYVHTVKIMNNTRFFDIIGKEEIKVNSRHKKTVATHPGLVVNCICEDGYIDGLESPDKTFYMALRFHPESLYKVDEYHNKIFEEFIRVCGGGR
ncbi:MAG: gamma-glutamyl-gamma-aminobutyrate hydrolase family protein, partial [Clostridia bacterium]|nr:gamma-glutamyl-gamma-aminobutyrate hydrolase family protein [Clostridia bacterium]